jgi:ABC-type branched-subunit amino acid transport system ATPase component
VSGEAPQEAPLLDVRGLRKRFGGLRVVEDLDLRIMPGETLALIGPNGSGKTTTLNLIAGALRADAGDVLFLGRNVARLAVHRRAELGIARTFQNGRVFGNMTARDNVLAGAFSRLRAARPFARLRALPVINGIALLAELAIALIRPPRVVAENNLLRAESERELARFGERVLPRIERRAFLFSYANRRRIEIARALVAEPALLLLDEPAAGMNPDETAELQAQLVSLRAAGQTMLLVEHKLDLVRALADRTIVLDGGVKIYDGSPHEFQNDPAVREAYLGSASAAGSDPIVARAGSEPASILQLVDVDAAYGSFRALSQVSLAVGTGEIVSLLGGNASGKSTTMKVVLGLLLPSRGRVVFGERDVTGDSTASRVAAGIASVPEARRVFPALSVEENLLTGAYVRRRALFADDFARVFDMFPRLAERRSQPAGTLSGGEQQMLAIGRALMSRPRLICMDEPTMGLAPRLVERVLSAIVEINAAGTAILMVEQNVGLALQIAHRGYVLASGTIVASGSAASLRDASAVREAYLGA